MTRIPRYRFLCLLIGVAFVLFGLSGGEHSVTRMTMAADNPVLLTQANSSRALAVASVTFMREPFSVRSTLLGIQSLTRIILFSSNLELLPGDDLSVVRAEAEDGNHQVYNLPVEYVGRVRDQPQLNQVILRLNDSMTDNLGDVFVQVSYRGLTSNRVRVGIGHIGDGPFVLEFDGANKAVDYGNFWPYGEDLGHFFWEFWAMPGRNSDSRYLVSDGYGGAHALLLGMGYSDECGRYPLTGNVFDGVGSTSFTSDDGPAPGEWGHIAVGWDGTNIMTYFDGVPVGKTAFVGPRREIGGAGGGGRLLVGGSDHQNFIGRIAQVRGYENSNPHESVNGNGASMAAFAPQTTFESGGTLLSSFTRPTLLVADRSGNNYVGVVRSTACGILFDCPNAPLPQFVIDPTAPSKSPAQPATFVDFPPLEPPGARVFDSFSRRNSTYAFDNIGGLDTTEGGTAGPQVWHYTQTENVLLPFGILNGRAVVLANAPSAAWVSIGDGPADLDIRVDRHPGPSGGSGIATGLVFRLRNSGNFFYAYTTGNTAATQSLTVGYVNSSATGVLITGAPMPASWTTLRVVTLASGDIQVYADSALLYATTTSSLATERNVGIWSFGNGQGLSNRWDNFTVLNAP
jgi:hypothetical protein